MSDVRLAGGVSGLGFDVQREENAGDPGPDGVLELPCQSI